MNTATIAELDALQAAGESASTAPAPATLPGASKARLGAITRELHDALRAIGATPELQRVIREIPDARERLSYVGEMTEKAAHRVLNLVDQAMPRLGEHGLRAGALAEQLAQQTGAAALAPEGASQIVERCGEFARESVGFAEQQKQILSDIMMTQDFQDLSGQVIKKVIDMITRTESQLVQLLIDDGEIETVEQPVEAELQGPQTPENALAQDDVDDLLASMGF